MIEAPVTIWQGTLDNWVPFAMGHYLNDRLPNVTAFKIIEGASHYSTLREALTGVDDGGRL
jgi:pimeloyl-ACP methyl ester carboxylesterase